MKNKIFILSGQSGVGKKHILKQVLKDYPNLQKIVTCTTRPPREDEIDGRDYVFLSKREFQEMIEDGEFFEFAHVHNWLYGTPKHQIERALRTGKSIILEIDVQGAMIVKEEIPEAVLIFLQYEPGKIANQIRNRLANDTSRGEVSEAEIEKRIESAEHEAQYKKDYQYIVTNFEGEPEKAINEIEKIIKKELEDK